MRKPHISSSFGKKKRSNENIPLDAESLGWREHPAAQEEASPCFPEVHAIRCCRRHKSRRWLAWVHQLKTDFKN